MEKLIINLMNIYFLDIFLFGKGTILKIHGISSRMILFFFIMLIGIIQILLGKKKLSKNILLILAVFSFSLIFYGIRGILNNAQLKYVLEDIKGVLPLYILLPASYNFKERNIKKIIKYLKKSSFIIAITYLILYLILKLEFIPFNSFYYFFSSVGKFEFLFRGKETFLYVGMIYLNISFLLEKNKIRKLILIIPIFLCKTRGFILGILISLMFYIYISYKKYRVLYIIGIGIICLLFYNEILRLILNSKNELRAISNESRFAQIREVFEVLSLKTFFLGHGFGVGVPTKPVHMEINWLEIFHKQGILGFLMYLIGCLWIIVNLLKLKNEEATKLALGLIFLMTVSMTNPFLSNIFGLTYIIILICYIRILKKE